MLFMCFDICVMQNSECNETREGLYETFAETTVPLNYTIESRIHSLCPEEPNA